MVIKNKMIDIQTLYKQDEQDFVAQVVLLYQSALLP